MTTARYTVVLLVTTLVAGCDRSQPAPAAPGAVSTPTAAATPTIVVEGPAIVFDRMEHDFGRISDTRKQSTSFTFTNAGDRRLEIREIKAACGCTVPTLEKRDYAPGESGTIDVTFDPKGRQGDTMKYITVISNARTQPTVRLTIDSLVAPMLEVQRMFRVGAVAKGAEHRVLVPFNYVDPSLQIRTLSVNNSAIRIGLDSIGEARAGGGYGGAFAVTVLADAPWGVLYATRLSFTAVTGRDTGDEIVQEYQVFLMGEVIGRLKAEPSMINVSQVRRGGRYQAATSLNSISGEPFTVLGVEVVQSNLPDVQVRVDRPTPDRAQIVVHGSTGDFTGSFRGVLRVRTDVPGEESLNLRFAGQVR